MKDKYKFGMFGIGTLAYLETLATLYGMNGTYFGLTLAGIGAIMGGVIGYSVKGSDEK